VFQGVPVAVKVLNVIEEDDDAIDLDERESQRCKRRQMIKDMAQEIRMACRMAGSATHAQHANLVMLVGASLDQVYSLKIVYELIEGNDLEKLLATMQSKSKTPWKPELSTALSWSCQLMEAIAFLHSFDPPIIHRDVKPSNVMVSNDLSLVKLVDFGLCTPDPRDSRKMSGKTGSYRYMAPEVYLESHSYSAKVREHILTRECILVR
jgi:serine/threonine protein kinase